MTPKNSNKGLETAVARIATPIIKGLVNQILKEELAKKTGFRAKKETATAQSSYEQRSYRGKANLGVGSVTVTGATSNGGGETPALISLIAVLADLNIIINKTTL